MNIFSFFSTLLSSPYFIPWQHGVQSVAMDIKHKEFQVNYNRKKNSFSSQDNWNAAFLISSIWFKNCKTSHNSFCAPLQSNYRQLLKYVRYLGFDDCFRYHFSWKIRKWLNTHTCGFDKRKEIPRDFFLKKRGEPKQGFNF